VYFSPNIIKIIKSRKTLAGHEACMLENTLRIFVGKPKGKRLLGTPRRR
jgi:hypothetical protein